ncbi:hypothetical protein C8F04DRAFT_1106106 [Mycena alexandri]|uniref:Uncharacterized protein n=1 Tax=Mycena alexandri TaxID=1745969 RepID=A0AAD6SLK0_9AGAR|nr:hypothetical protein C8F04DRAFT_1115494 [Mycena alexandri]KAJ7032901.1 hypothetical protein C8F04DRAFT_1106106 [Mycena alexandri]
MASTDFQVLSEVPNELWLQIISHYAYSFDFHCPLLRQEDRKDRGPLRQTLRSLSQISSTLRALTIPFLWERFDISESIVQPPSELKLHLLPHIKSVHIWWENRSPTEVETLALVGFLKTLPKLIGLQIEVYDTTQTFTRVLGSASLPNVTTLSIPDSLHGIFYAFPNLTTLAFPSLFFDSPALEPAKTHFPHLEALIGLRFLNDNDHENLAQDFVDLRVLAVASVLKSKGVVSRLRAFKNLNELSLFDGIGSMALPLEELVEGGRAVLRASHARGSKFLRVWKDDQAGPRLIHFERC